MSPTTPSGECPAKTPFAWLVAGGGFLLHAIGSGLVVNTTTLFVKPISEDLGFSRGDYSIAMLCGAVGMAIAAPFVGPLIDRVGARRVMGFALVLMLGGFSVNAACSRLEQFYAASFVGGIGVAACTFVPALIIVNNWFVLRRGLANGIVLAGSGAGAAVFSVVGSGLIDHAGWRAAYLVLGGLGAAVLIPVVAGLVWLYPADRGMVPHGWSAADDTPTTRADMRGDGMSVKAALRMGSFWMLGIFVFIICLVTQAIQVHFVPFISDSGYSAGAAGLLYTLTMGVLVAGKLGLGALCDWVGVGVATLISLGVYLATLAAALAAGMLPFAVLFGLLFGFANATSTVLAPMWTTKLVGTRHFGALFGILNIFVILGSGFGSPMAGYIYDLTGSYTALFVGTAVALVVAGTAILLASRGRPTPETVDLSEIDVARAAGARTLDR